MKKRIAVLLTVAMAAAAVFSPMTAAAASGTASSIRLEQTQGSVTVKNSAGKELKASSGSRLNSGSSVSTAKASYAYMSLDSSKAAKLDASSKASVRKSGSKLELRSEKGSLMFNVSSPLKSSENMNIRTSSMVAGVRGTAGWVFNPDANTSVIYLLEGALDVSAIDPVTGEQKQVAITGGQGVFATRDTSGKYAENGVTITIPGMGGPRTIILREETESLHVISFEFKEEDVPGFVAVEVANDPQLQQKITDLTDLSVPEIIGAAEEKLASEEAAAEEKDTEIQQALEEVTVETTDQVFESTKESSSGGGGGYTPPAATAYEVTAASYGAIVQGISDAEAAGASEVNVTMSGNGDFTSNDNLSVPGGMTVNLSGGQTLTIG
ncbi:MAG: FecR domain-containing protein, partial [Anaerovoracaceae bacterium]